MKLIRINKYILNIIFTHLNYNYKLNVIKYNKQIQSKLEISLYNYQKKYFERIATPAILNNLEIFLKNKIFDKKTLDKLKLDWENESNEIIKKKDCFHLDEKTNKKNLKDIKILNISSSAQNLLQKNWPNLIELNLSNIKNLELPCSILLNLESFSLKNISKIKFLTIEDNISLNKLKHLYLNNISFNKENKINININNVKYLDLRIKEQDGSDEDCDFDNDNNKAGFNKEKTLKYLMKIFDLQFLSVFNIDSNISENEEEKDEENEEDEDFEDEEDLLEKYQELEGDFKNPEKLFDKKYMEKYDYFNFKILYEYYTISGAAEFEERFKYKYLFAKTKGNKYLFKTEYTSFGNFDGEIYEEIIKEIRYCNEINYDNYYFINNEGEIGGDNFRKENIDYEKVNCLSIVSKYDTYSYALISTFDVFQENENRLEIISIEDLNLDIIKLDSFLNNLKKFKNLKCFYITKECIFQDNKLFIALLTDLSKIKSLFLIEIVIKGELKLSKNDEKKINEILPDILIKKGKEESHINWYNHNYEFKIENKDSYNLIDNQMDIDE